MHSLVKLVGGLGLLLPGLMLTLRGLKVAPPALEAITSFFFGSARPSLATTLLLVAVGGVLVFSATMPASRDGR